MARYGFTHACVDTAPTPGLTYGQMEPTAGTAVLTATPSWPVRGQWATMEKVIRSDAR